MEKDFTQCIRDVDRIQAKLDEVFKRTNADPIYFTETQIKDAISDNVRYFGEDRKADLCEIFFAILEQIYDRIVKQDKSNIFCNPSLDPQMGERLPEMDMLMRCMMPLSWALSAKWPDPEFIDTADEYILSFTADEAGIIYECLIFLFRLFPEVPQNLPQQKEFLEYWEKVARNREVLSPETDQLKSKMLSILIQKKLEFMKK